jgi:hypothetical protein
MSTLNGKGPPSRSGCFNPRTKRPPGLSNRSLDGAGAWVSKLWRRKSLGFARKSSSQTGNKENTFKVKLV